MILWRVWATRCLDGDEKKFMLDWTPFRSVPQVVPRPRPRPDVSVEGNGQKKTQ
jgi:dihydroceramidase